MVRVIIGQGSRDFAHNLDDLLQRWQFRHEIYIKRVDLKSVDDVRKMGIVQFADYIKNIKTKHLIELNSQLSIVLANTKEFLVVNPTASTDREERSWYFSAVQVKKKCGGYINAIGSEVASRPKPVSVKVKNVSSIFADLIWDEEIIPRGQFLELMKRAKSIYKSQR